MTKRLLYLTVAMIAASTNLVSCIEGNNGFDDSGMGGMPGGGGYMPGDSGSGSNDLIDFGTLSSFTVELNTAALSEKETIPTDESDTYYNEYIENNFSQKNVTTITLNGSSDATVEGLVKGDTILVNSGKIDVRAYSKGLTLKVCGSTSDGALHIRSDKKFQLLLSDTEITNPDGAAINIQNGNCFLTLEGDNALSDASSATYTAPEGEDMKAVLFSEDDLRFNGKGSLTITASNGVGKAGISCDDAIFIRPNTRITVKAGASAGNGIKANDAIVIKGGVLNVEVAAAGKKGLSSNGYMQIAGGRATIITTGGVDATDATDPTGSAAIKCDSVLHILAGELRLKSTGQGGKGISGDDTIRIAGGDLYIITEGAMYGKSSSSMGPGGGWGSGSSSSSNSVSPKGIRCDKDICIEGGNIYVRTSGGTNAEGIESKTRLSFSGGNTAALSYDDGFNAKDISISGGKALAISNGNCDGIDSNGAITATGGVLIGVSSTLGSEDGLDTETTLSVSNATVIGLSVGGFGMGRTSGHYIDTKVSGSAGDYVALCDGSTPLVTFRLPRTYQNGKLFLSTPTLTSGSYSLQTGVSPKDGTLWMNYLEGCTSVSGGSSTSVSAK